MMTEVPQQGKQDCCWAGTLKLLIGLWWGHHGSAAPSWANDCCVELFGLDAGAFSPVTRSFWRMTPVNRRSKTSTQITWFIGQHSTTARVGLLSFVGAKNYSGSRLCLQRAKRTWRPRASWVHSWGFPQHFHKLGEQVE